jgi:predicted nucleic acid-binding protein
VSLLVDTGVWIEFFRERPSLPAEALARLAELVREDQVVIIEPVRAELLSGRLSAERRGEISDTLDALRRVDLDWSARKTWDDIVSLAASAHGARLAVPGIIDRMVLAAAKAAGARLWTLDPRLSKLAAHFGVEGPGQPPIEKDR